MGRAAMYSPPKGQSAMSSLWACCCIQSPPSGRADVLPDGSHLDPGPTVAGSQSSQDSCLVMVVNVTISHRLDSWTECSEKSRCWPYSTWFCYPNGQNSQCSGAHPGLCLWKCSYCTKQAPLYWEAEKASRKMLLLTNIFWLHLQPGYLGFPITSSLPVYLHPSMLNLDMSSSGKASLISPKGN